ncbi:MAG: DUF1631 family protein, partial [Gammaproteobacteria bacterium]|nr:DUF1631 family protein [Gammaproteobacteria bacterium]
MEQSTAQSQTGESRRAYTRQEITLKALVHPDTGRSWLCNIKDFCRGGMFLVSEGVGSLQSSGCNPQRDDGVGIHFTVPTVEGEQQFRLQARVARVTADGNGIGVFFPDGMDQLALDTLEEFAPAAGGGPDDDQAVQSAQIIAIPEFKFNPDDAGQLLGELQTIVTDAVEQIGKSFFEDADKDLLEHAGYASDADQSRYFDAMTDLGQCKDGVTTAFSRAIEDHLENTLDAAVSLDQQPDDQPAGATSGLALVNIGQFESWLVLAEIISKLEFRFDLELEEMHAQLALIAGPWRNRKTLPVGPSVVARAFDEALNLVQVDQEVKLLLYRTFQDGLVPQLEKLYDAINKLLADSDMFPLLDELLAQQQRISSPAVGKGPTASGDVEPPQTAAETDVPGAEEAPSNGPAATPIKGNTPDRQRNIAESSYAEGYTASTRDVFEAATTLLNLKDQSRRGLGTGQGETDANPETYSPNEVTDALRELQRERSGTPIETNEIRDRLLNLLRWSEDGAQDKRIGDSEADAMDVVGNLVTSIREDKLLPEGVKDWVKRLELTLTKLATQDPGFFANQSKQPHPAMQVLDQLAKLGDTLDKGDDVNLESGGSEVDSLMRRVVDEFDGNPKIFHEVLEELNPLVDRQTRTYQGNLQRTVRVCEGQQRLSSARRDVVDEVEQRLSGRQLPQLILELLNPGWRNLLVHHHLRHGRDSESWKQNLEILEQLVDHLSGSVEPGSPDYVEASELLSAVETGLTSISFEPVRRAPLLRRISQALAGSGERDLVKLESGDCARALGLEDLVPETDPASEHDDPASQGEWSRWLDQARSLKVGDWLAATDDSDGREILSLAWIGEEHANFILVDAKGLKAREFTLRQLVQSLMDGTVVRLDEFNLP